LTPSRPPNCVTAAWSIASTCSCIVTSVTRATTFVNPFCWRPRSAWVNRSSVLAQISTCAPASRHASAQARPIPMLPPVTAIRFPVRSLLLCMPKSILPSGPPDGQHLESQALQFSMARLQHVLGIEQHGPGHRGLDPPEVERQEIRPLRQNG